MNAPSGTQCIKTGFETGLFFFFHAPAGTHRQFRYYWEAALLCVCVSTVLRFVKRNNTRPSLAKRNVRKLLPLDCRLDVTADYQSAAPKDRFSHLQLWELGASQPKCLAAAAPRELRVLPSLDMCFLTIQSGADPAASWIISITARR